MCISFYPFLNRCQSAISVELGMTPYQENMNGAWLPSTVCVEKRSRKSDSDYLIFVSPELCSERDYVITHSVRSMCM